MLHKNLIIALVAALCTFTSATAQWQRGFVYADGTIRTQNIPAPTHGQSRDGDFAQLPGFPLAFPADPTFKNFRNLTLADLDGDGVTEILLATQNKLRVFQNNTLLWEKDLSGTAIFPPSVADVNNDGQPEIVQATGGTGGNGRLYLLDRDGADFPNWPLNFSGHWILSAPALADVDEDAMMEIIFCERTSPAGRVHLVRLDGTTFSEAWPVVLDNTPAVTPSVGDVDQDGSPEIVVHSTSTRYIFGLDGQPKPGFPIVTQPFQRYSFQSPILVDLDDAEDLEIVGATHGDNTTPDPEFYVMKADGSALSGWPVPVPENTWTFSTPTVVQMDSAYQIFMSRPIGPDADDMLYGWDANGNLLPGFPIVKAGGLEGIITVADIDDDGAMELIFGSNLLRDDGRGFLHAYEMDGTGEVPGFPICPRGWTLINGANPGDVNNDGLMDLSVLTYTQNFGAAPDSVFLNVYDLAVPYAPERVAWGTYKGSNDRAGLVNAAVVSAVNARITPVTSAALHPNPASTHTQLSFDLQQNAYLSIQLQSSNGQYLRTIQQGLWPAGPHQLSILMNNLPRGVFFISIRSEAGAVLSKKLIKE